jgi:hypothetical protein
MIYVPVEALSHPLWFINCWENRRKECALQCLTAVGNKSYPFHCSVLEQFSATKYKIVAKPARCLYADFSLCCLHFEQS